MAALLRESPERVKREFQGLGVTFTVSIVLDNSCVRFCARLEPPTFRPFSLVWVGLLYYRPIGPSIGTVKFGAQTRYVARSAVSSAPR